MRRRVIIGVAVCLGALIACFVVLRVAQSSPLAKFHVVAGGIRYTVEGVTFGTNHQFSTDAALTRAFRRVLPKFIERLLPPGYQLENQTTDPEALVYVSAFDTLKRIYLAPSFEQFRAYDEHGCAFQVNSWSGAYGAPSFCATAVHLRSFPRRAPAFRLRMYPPGGAGFVEVKVPNPVKGSFPKWTPEPLPARRTVEETAFELRALRLHSTASSEHQIQPQFAVLRNAADITREWSTIPEFLDATGNRGAALCPYEPAWGVETKFRKNSRAEFKPEEIWRIPSVRVPENGRLVLFNQDHTLARATLHLIALVGPGQFKISNGIVIASAPWNSSMVASTSASTSMENGRRQEIVEHSSDTAALMLSTGSLRDMSDLLIRYRDQTARVSEAGSWRSANRQYCFTLPNLQKATVIDLELIVREPIAVRYTVKPPAPSNP